MFLFHINIGGSSAISSGTDINNWKQAILTSPPLQFISITSDGWLVWYLSRFSSTVIGQLDKRGQWREPIENNWKNTLKHTLVDTQPKAAFPPQELYPGTRDFGPVLSAFPPREPGTKSSGGSTFLKVLNFRGRDLGAEHADWLSSRNHHIRIIYWNITVIVSWNVVLKVFQARM